MAAGILAIIFAIVGVQELTEKVVEKVQARRITRCTRCHARGSQAHSTDPPFCSDDCRADYAMDLARGV